MEVNRKYTVHLIYSDIVQILGNVGKQMENKKNKNENKNKKLQKSMRFLKRIQTI